MRFRVRYSETDQMGTFYNSRALEWFEVGRTELLRAIGRPYAEMESRGVLLPLAEAHVEYLGRARYDDELEMSVTAQMSGRARVRFDVQIAHVGEASKSGDGATGSQADLMVAKGYTVHAVTDPSGRPIRPPAWFCQAISACGSLCQNGPADAHVQR